MKKFISTAVFIAFAGCVPKPGSPEERATQGQELLIVNYVLPAEAANIRTLTGGNGWHTFDLVIEGQKRHFLRRYSHGDDGTESMVEITPR